MGVFEYMINKMTTCKRIATQDNYFTELHYFVIFMKKGKKKGCERGNMSIYAVYSAFPIIRSTTASSHIW